MHEVYIAESLLETVIFKCKENGFNCVKTIKVKIGKASMVSADSLIFAFDALKVGSIAENASLIVDVTPSTGYCKVCIREFDVDKDFIFECPFCKSDKVIIKTGNGVDLTELEVEI